MYKFINIAIIVFCIIEYMKVWRGESFDTLERGVSDGVKNTPAFICYESRRKENEWNGNILRRK